MSTAEEAAVALKALDGSNFGGRPLRANLATDNRRPPGAGPMRTAHRPDPNRPSALPRTAPYDSSGSGTRGYDRDYPSYNRSSYPPREGGRPYDRDTVPYRDPAFNSRDYPSRGPGYNYGGGGGHASTAPNRPFNEPYPPRSFSDRSTSYDRGVGYERSDSRTTTYGRPPSYDRGYEERRDTRETAYRPSSGYPPRAEGRGGYAAGRY